MKKNVLLFLSVMVLSCNSGAQVDLTKLSPAQWEEDLNSLSSRMNKSFAGFTPGIKKQFNDEVETIRQKLPRLSSIQVMMDFSRLVALLQEGHTEFNLSNPNTGFKRFPLFLYYFNNDLFIVATGEANKTMVGQKVIKIGELTTDIILEKLKPYINHDNEMEFLHSGPGLIVIAEILFALDIIKNPQEALFTVSDNSGVISTHSLTSIGFEEYRTMKRITVYENPPYYLNSREKNYWFSYLENEKISYLSIKRILNQNGEKSVRKTISDFFSDVDTKKPGKVVIDFRLCPGGNYELALPILEEIKKRPEINQKGKLFIVTGRTTFSAALVTCIYLKDETNALLIGEPGRGTPNRADNVDNYKLPNSKLDFDCTNRFKVHSEKIGNTDRLPVDILIIPSFVAYKAGRDEVLEKIIQYQ